MAIASVLYGILTALFFQCMTALFNPVNRRRQGTRWWLISYTIIMFLVATAFTGMTLHVGSISYIDNRKFTGVKDVFPPGPLGYQSFIRSTAFIIADFLPLLNYWLADGLLLYHCYVIYSMNLWVIAFPCLMYLATVATGVMITLSHVRVWHGSRVGIPVDLVLRHLSISVSLNVLLTLMIVTRLVLHGRTLRTATGSPSGTSRLYKTMATMFIESSALFSVSALLLIGLWAAGSSVAYVFPLILAETQVIAPLLFIQRVANRTALTSDTFVTRHTTWVTRGDSTDDDGTIPAWYLMGPGGNSKKNSFEVEDWFKTTIDLLRNVV